MELGGRDRSKEAEGQKGGIAQEQEENLDVMNILITLIKIMVSQVCTYVKLEQTL